MPYVEWRLGIENGDWVVCGIGIVSCSVTVISINTFDLAELTSTSVKFARAMLSRILWQ